ncbi:MAG: FHA domain-containing protein [Chloroflexi bacterium]|nr:MAG: FHA domain-containing protein [Chloroflexota bacterium]MBL1196641.1 FHA domain-containing protein [Chloroflexota bacterium]NOH13934.1 FHA domain-containing protein [Chloroflexota bacterium]
MDCVKIPRVSKPTGGLIAVVLACLFLPLVAYAQTPIRATLSPPVVESFPRMSAYLDVRDEQGNFLSGLTAADVTVIENNSPFPASELNEIRPGAQIVVAFNLDDTFAIRDGEGNTRYDYLVSNLSEWATSKANAGDQNDDLSIVVPSGNLVQHTTNSIEWLNALQVFEADLQSTSPGLDVLSRAVELAADPVPKGGMGRVVLFMTPALDASLADALQNQADRANDAGVRILVWLVDSQSVFESPGVNAMRAMAEQTGGSLEGYSGSEVLPDLENLIEPYRRVYQLGYQSQVDNSGSHQVVALIRQGDAELTTAPQNFEMQIAPPAATFVSLPAEVVRSNPPGDAEALEQLLPTVTTIDILIEFPDDIPRQIVRSTLYANGEAVAENGTAPFEQFNWDLTEYEGNQVVVLSAEIEDEIGLASRSVDTPIQISIQRAPVGLSSLLARYGAWLAGGIALLAGAVLLLVLVLSGRLSPQPMGARRKVKTSPLDPVTQPVAEVTPPDTQPGRFAQIASRISAPRLRWPQRRSGQQQPYAYLAPITEQGEPRPGEIEPVVQPEIIFGSDVSRTSIPLDDDSLEAVHSRLWRDDEGVVHLADLETVAGTWINYAPVTTDGGRVQHGDLIHIGKVGFRFTESNPTRTTRPRAILQERES